MEKSSSSKFLVTGGAGFIGSHIVEELIKRGETVRVLDNFSTGNRENIKHLKDKVELIEGDIRDFWTVVDAVKGIDFIIHQAALPSVQRSINNPLTSNEVNVNGTLNLLEAAKGYRVKRFIYASSSSVYGDTPTLPKREDMPSKPLSPYAITKLAGEEYCQTFSKLYGLPTVCLRYFNVFGTRQDPTSQYSAVIPKFIELLLDKKTPVIYGDGEQSRDFTFVRNVVEANLLACQSDISGGEVINIACGQSFSLNQLVSLLNQIIGTNIKPEYGQAKPGDVKHSLADISKAKKLLGYKPRISFAEGMKKTVEWFRNQKER
ncbi:MAG: SDR family oxidoreductase [candidate division Zixibacteria bacterium]|nr:SDR family oxidoreductase [candidate division Zixibacteria bacterium]